MAILMTIVAPAVIPELGGTVAAADELLWRRTYRVVPYSVAAFFAEIVFGDDLAPISPDSRLAMHIDTDEANAAEPQTGAQAYIAGIQNKG
jgi:hypothetical protein